MAQTVLPPAQCRPDQEIRRGDCRFSPGQCKLDYCKGLPHTGCKTIGHLYLHHLQRNWQYSCKICKDQTSDQLVSSCCNRRVRNAPEIVCKMVVAVQNTMLTYLDGNICKSIWRHRRHTNNSCIIVRPCRVAWFTKSSWRPYEYMLCGLKQNKMSMLVVNSKQERKVNRSHSNHDMPLE